MGCSPRRLPTDPPVGYVGGMEWTPVLSALPPSFAGVTLVLRRLRPNSCCSHLRMVSRPILIPINPRPTARVSAESPAWASRSNSSRCGSNCAVAWLRGCRAWATAWASVVGRGGVSGDWIGNDMGAIRAQYVWWSGRARGAPGAHSKRKRLDVGVLSYCFLLFWFSQLGSSLDFLVSEFTGLIDLLVFSFGSLAELDCLSAWVLGLIEFQSKFVFGIVGLSLVAGGGGC